MNTIDFSDKFTVWLHGGKSRDITLGDRLAGEVLSQCSKPLDQFIEDFSCNGELWNLCQHLGGAGCQIGVKI